MLRRFLAGQFARPSGLIGRLWISPWLDRIARDMNRLTLDRLDVRPGDRVLEIGFGGGGLIAMLLDGKAGEIVGVDLSPDIVDRAEGRFRSAVDSRRLRLHRASVESMPLDDAAVDKACSVNNVYFWPDPAAAFRELARVIRPGGRLVLSFEPPEELAKWPGHRFGFRAYETEDLTTLARAAGFGDPQAVVGTGRKPDRFICLSLTRGRDEEPA